MSVIAPNLSALVGANIAARLMSAAGGLTALSKIPGCNLQVVCLSVLDVPLPLARSVLRKAEAEWFGRPAWSPDENFIAYSAEPERPASSSYWKQEKEEAKDNKKPKAAQFDFIEDW